MIIDCHAHAAGVFFKKDTLVAELNRLNVDKVVLAPMGVDPDQTYSQENMDEIFKSDDVDTLEEKISDLISYISEIIYDAPNKYLYSLKQQCPERIIQFYWANPNDPDIIEDLEHYFPLWNFSGVKLHQMVGGFDTDQESVHQIADFCEFHDIPLFIHLFTPANVFQFIDLLTEHQHTRFIVGHMIGYNILAEHAMGLDNFWFDISPRFLVPNTKIRKAIKQFGAERIMLGSDTPLGGNKNLEHNIQRVNRMQLTDSEREKILGLNMKAMLKL